MILELMQAICSFLYLDAQHQQGSSPLTNRVKGSYVALPFKKYGKAEKESDYRSG